MAGRLIYHSAPAGFCLFAAGCPMNTIGDISLYGPFSAGESDCDACLLRELSYAFLQSLDRTPSTFQKFLPHFQVSLLT